jgi:hypothetical protein
MPKPVILLLLFSLTMARLAGQILTTEMGRVSFFNTLDSAKSAWITALSRKCYCLLEMTDSSHAIRLKLDLDTDSNTADTPLYILDFNILSGNLVLPSDSVSTTGDPQAESPGIYIKVRDSVVREDATLRLLDYGIRHYSELKLNRQSGKMYGREFINQLLAQKPSLKLRRAIAYCQR